jgi:serine/threonine-protein kinase
MEDRLRKIGPYNLLTKLGSGTFGVVWLAEKQSSITTTRFALKLPRGEDIDFDAFKREADIWVQASGHPNVLPLIDADVYDGQAVIVSEYAPDGSLEDWRARHGGRAPSPEAACEIIEGVLAGLEHLHGRRIIHRDLKPDNILLQRDTPRLTDFGISRLLRSSSHFTKNISGTFVYMAPEAFDGKRDERTDIWAVGVILYELLAGRLPYDQQDTASLIGAIVRHDPPPLHEGLVPEALRRVVMKALERDPAKRYASAAEMRGDLREAGHRLWFERREASRRVPETRVAGDAKAGDVKAPAPETRLASNAVASAAESIPSTHTETTSPYSVATPDRREEAKATQPPPASVSKPAIWRQVLIWVFVGAVSGVAIFVALWAAGITVWLSNSGPSLSDGNKYLASGANTANVNAMNSQAASPTPAVSLTQQINGKWVFAEWANYKDAVLVMQDGHGTFSSDAPFNVLQDVTAAIGLCPEGFGFILRGYNPRLSGSKLKPPTFYPDELCVKETEDGFEAWTRDQAHNKEWSAVEIQTQPPPVQADGTAVLDGEWQFIYPGKTQVSLRMAGGRGTLTNRTMYPAIREVEVAGVTESNVILKVSSPALAADKNTQSEEYPPGEFELKRLDDGTFNVYWRNTDKPAPFRQVKLKSGPNKN